MECGGSSYRLPPVVHTATLRMCDIKTNKKEVAQASRARYI